MEWIPESDCVALRAYHSNYLSAPPDGLVHANQASKTMYEHWKLIDVGGDADGDGGAGTILIGLQSAHGTVRGFIYLFSRGVTQFSLMATLDSHPVSQRR